MCYKVLTHITLLGEPMEDPGGEIEASERRLCCVTKHTNTFKKKKSRAECNKFEMVLSNYFTLSLLSALAACLHNGCHTSHPEEE